MESKENVRLDDVKHKDKVTTEHQSMKNNKQLMGQSNVSVGLYLTQEEL